MILIIEIRCLIAGDVKISVLGAQEMWQICHLRLTRTSCGELYDMKVMPKNEAFAYSEYCSVTAVRRTKMTTSFFLILPISNLNKFLTAWSRQASCVSGFWLWIELDKS